MSSDFDPYHQWLGIPSKDQPANHYRLLGIEQFEGDADVILLAADQRMTFLRTFQGGERAELSQRLLNEVAAAKLCLLDANEKARYDTELKARMPADAPPPLPAEDDSNSAFAAFAAANLTSSPSNRRQFSPNRKGRRVKKKTRVPGVAIAFVILLVIVLVGLIFWGKEKKQRQQIARNPPPVAVAGKNNNANAKLRPKAATEKTPTTATESADHKKKTPQSKAKKETERKAKEEADRLAKKETDREAKQAAAKLTAARQTLSDKGLEENEQGDWEPAAAKACRTLQAKLKKNRSLYYTTFDQAIETQKAKWNKEFNTLLTSRKDNEKMIALGKLLPKSIEVNVNGQSSKPPRSPAEILIVAKNEVSKGKKVQAELNQIQNKFQADLEALQRQQATLKQRYRQSKNSKPVREALRTLGGRLATAPSWPTPANRKSPSPASGNRGLDQLIRATQVIPDNDAGLVAERNTQTKLTPGEVRVFQTLFDKDGDQWRHKQEAELEMLLKNIKTQKARISNETRSWKKQNKLLFILNRQLDKQINAYSEISFPPQKQKVHGQIIQLQGRIEKLQHDCHSLKENIQNDQDNTRKQLNTASRITRKIENLLAKYGANYEIKTQVPTYAKDLAMIEKELDQIKD